MPLTNGSSLSQRHFSFAIVGGGFSGATLAAQLLRQGSDATSVVVVERSPARGRGIAYGTADGCHLLNVPAGNMSARADDPNHFVQWARQNIDPAIDRYRFVPRRIYGLYLEAILEDAQALHGDRLLWVEGDAISVFKDQGLRLARIHLACGREILADKVILALGNFPGSDPALPGKASASWRYAANAWSTGSLDQLPPVSDVLLIGTGLTSVDIVMALRQRGLRGTIHMLSRRGLLPQTHKDAASWPAFWSESSPRTTRALLRLLRNEARDANAQGGDWRAVVGSLRPATQKIWNSLPHAEKRRFLRHLRPYWEVHRHRIAPEIGALIDQELTDGGIRVHAGRITAYAEDQTGVTVSYRSRTARGTENEVRQIRVARVINCTGPETDLRKLNQPLMGNLSIHKLTRPDALFLGLDVSSEGALIDAYGQPSDFLYAVGPARKGQLWETTAVPEIREQVVQLVDHLLGSHRGTDSLERARAEMDAFVYMI